MNLRSIALATLMMTLSFDQFAHAQDSCVATTEAELQALLDCIANCGTTPCTVPGCVDICSHKHIRIPAATTLEFFSTIELNAAHQGLQLTINGTLQYAGPPGTSNSDMPYLFFITGAPNQDLDITINGTGTIRTPYVACQSYSGQQQTCVEPPGGVMYIAEGIVIRNHARGVTVKNLRMENMFWAILADTTATDLVFQNLTIDDMTLYGIFNDGMGVTIDNCHFDGMYHGFGIGNHGSDVQISNCTVINSGGGFHVRGGSNIRIDGFKSHGQWCNVGPDPGIPNDQLRVSCVEVRNLTITGGHPGHLLYVDNGISNCWIENLTTENSLSLEIGRTTWVPLRPINAVHWKNVSGDYFIYDHACIGDVGPRLCRADLSNDGGVGVPDLLMVINSWGNCAIGAVCGQANYNCAGNIPAASDLGCDSVGVPDLLAIINEWGPCGG